MAAEEKKAENVKEIKEVEEIKEVKEIKKVEEKKEVKEIKEVEEIKEVKEAKEIKDNASERKWYYADEYRSRKGPISLSKISEMIRDGKVQSLSLCWKKGMAKWDEMRNVEQFKDLFAKKIEIEKDVKNFEKMTGTTSKTPGSKRKRKRAKSSKKKWKKVEDHSNVYVTGIPKEIKLSEFIKFFSKCGIIRKDPLTDKPRVKLYKDANGELKGDGLVMYLKPESVQLATEMLDDTYITPEKKICVSKAEFTMKGSEFKLKKEKTDGDIVKKLTNRKIALAKNQNRELCWDDEQENELAGKSGLRIVILRPMFCASEAAESADAQNFYDDLGKEVGLECERISGAIEKLTVFEGSQSGAIAVKFKTPASAARCISVMDGRFFSGKRIVCEYFDGTDHRANAEETESEQKKRIEEFGKWLESS